MAEVNTAEAEAQADAAFGAGFGVTPPAPAEMVVVEQPTPEPAKPEPVAVPVVVPEKPQYVRLTKQEWDNTKAAAGKVSSLESQVAKLTGSMPKAEHLVQQVIEKVQSQTPAGSPITLTKEDLAELSDDFPELSEKLLAGLGRAFERASVKGTGPAPAATPPAPTVDVKAEVRSALQEEKALAEADALAETYPDWSDIVGRPPMPGDPVPEGNPFRAWLATQEAAYREKVENTNSPAVVQAAIDRFKASQSTSASPSPRPDKAAARRAVIEDAVTPRADGNPPPLNTPQTAEEAFGNAFKAVKSH